MTDPPDTKNQPAEPPGFFTRARRSCHDWQFFRYPVEEPIGPALWYLTKLLLIATLLSTLALTIQAWSIADKITASLETELPTVTYDNGDLELNGKTPAFFSLYNDNRLAIDPDGELSRKELPHDVLVVLINGYMFIRGPNDEFRSISTRMYDSPESSQNSSSETVRPGTRWTFDGSDLRKYLFYIKAALAGAALLSALAGTVFSKLMFLFLISTGGILAMFEEPTRLELGDILKISTYAITPTVLAEILSSLTGIWLPYQTLWLLLGATLWTYVIVKQLAQTPDYRDKSI